MKTFNHLWSTYSEMDGLALWEVMAALAVGMFLLAVIAPGSILAGLAIAGLALLLITIIVRAVIAWWRDPVNLVDLF